jgi:flagellin-specific chaperone FliS
MLVVLVELIKMVELENRDSLIQPAACGQGINGLNLTELYAFDNITITNVSFMKNLKILDACYTCGIDQLGIDGLDLNEFMAKGNEKIKNVSFMKNLKILHADSNCGIDQEGIDGLDLFKLYVYGNNKITNISFMKNLKNFNRSSQYIILFNK